MKGVGRPDKEVRGGFGVELSFAGDGGEAGGAYRLARVGRAPCHQSSKSDQIADFETRFYWELEPFSSYSGENVFNSQWKWIKKSSMWSCPEMEERQVGHIALHAFGVHPATNPQS